MIRKKLTSVLIALIIICTFNYTVFAEFFSISVGIPVVHTFTDNWSGSGKKIESDGVSGAMLHIKFPIMVGLGIESHETSLKQPVSTFPLSDMKLITNLIDVFYFLPIPVVNITLGLGVGNVSLECTTNSGNCSDNYEAGIATQLWGQLGFPVIPLIDVHVSYHAISAKVKGKENIDNLSFGGSIVAVGFALVF